MSHPDVDVLLGIVEKLLAVQPHCLKGCCMTPATRVGAYKTGDPPRLVARWPSCDQHGMSIVRSVEIGTVLDGNEPPGEDYPHADVIRAAEQVLVLAGRPPWWIEYSGRNAAPSSGVMLEMRAKPLTLADWTLRDLLDDVRERYEGHIRAWRTTTDASVDQLKTILGPIEDLLAGLRSFIEGGGT